MARKKFDFDFRGRKITVEVGELAQQTNGSVLVRYEDTAVLSVVVVKEDIVNYDYFPLMVLYQERLYAVGKIPGGFIKREGRPTENATLTARLIDRPIRPLFPTGFMNDTQIINTVLSVDQDNSPEMMALLGSSLALGISNIPFQGPVAGVNIGRVKGKFIINPTTDELEQSDLDLIVAGTKDSINMVEAGSKEISEKDMLAAIMFGHKAIKELISFQEAIIKAVGLPKKDYSLFIPSPELREKVTEMSKAKLAKALLEKNKIKREQLINTITNEVLDKIMVEYKDDKELTEILKQAELVLEEIEYHEVRRLIVEEKIRPDGRKAKEIRPLSSQIDVLGRTHGSALFTRGQTQALSTTTLGAIGEHQILDGLGIEEGKRFMLHYNFPSFSVGETGRYGPPNRREVGHGALGERALLQVIPSEEEFPYTIRVVSEILESNGSTSQASICAGCLSLMAAGVPIKAPVAGIAMGLIMKDKQYTILTDIQGLEDFRGDMDFKVAGTKNGICALQMDIKIKGITLEILEEALEQARIGRLAILDNMTKTISKPRKELSKYAPKIKQIQIKPTKIKDVIGRGGETITNIIDQCDDVKIDIEDDGRVIVYHKDYAMIDKALGMIEDLVREVEDGKIYTGKVVRIEEFGCFVELWPGCDGLVHISHLDSKRVERVGAVVKLGDEIIVKAIGYDRKGRLNLSRREALK
ncbi:MAG: polyribonucleotide nucleotidyltransferase [Bacilli bacterium]|jgi:polyribonucleotide nucleotidyltransferase|nr:polyribonucleotide nucleotidyltransferase [Bacilli bacterium]